MTSQKVNLARRCKILLTPHKNADTNIRRHRHHQIMTIRLKIWKSQIDITSVSRILFHSKFASKSESQERYMSLSKILSVVALHVKEAYKISWVGRGKKKSSLFDIGTRRLPLIDAKGSVKASNNTTWRTSSFSFKIIIKKECDVWHYRGGR